MDGDRTTDIRIDVRDLEWRGRTRELVERLVSYAAARPDSPLLVYADGLAALRKQAAKQSGTRRFVLYLDERPVEALNAQPEGSS